MARPAHDLAELVMHGRPTSFYCNTHNYLHSPKFTSLMTFVSGKLSDTDRWHVFPLPFSHPPFPPARMQLDLTRCALLKALKFAISGSDGLKAEHFLPYRLHFHCGSRYVGRLNACDLKSTLLYLQSYNERLILKKSNYYISQLLLCCTWRKHSLAWGVHGISHVCYH